MSGSVNLKLYLVLTYPNMGCHMLEADLKVSKPRPNADRDSIQIMYDFLELSARPETSGAAMEDHLLGSLAIAYHVRRTAN